MIITQEIIDPAAERQKLLAACSGGFVSFEGWVRDHHQGRAVKFLHYSAYPEMATKVGAQILATACQRFAIDGARAVHRYGDLKIGEIAVWVGVSAGHRGAAFEACRFIIDTIKEEVPIWKHEFYEDGSDAWTLNHVCG